MVYRIANDTDFPTIKAFLDRFDYFESPRHWGGHWIIAEELGELRATFWFMAEPPYAYVDYWAGNGVPAIGVARVAERIMQALGVKHAHGMVGVDNECAQITAIKRLDATSTGRAYYTFSKEL